MDEELQVRDVLNDAWRLARKSSRISLIVGSLLTLSFTATDVFLTETLLISVQWVLALITLYLQLLITGVALSKAGLAGYAYDPRSPTRGRFASAFGQSLIYLVALIAGLALLVVPGLVLLVRWSVALPALLAEDSTISDSLRRSWNLTRRDWGPVGIVQVIVVFLWLAPISIVFATYPEFGTPSIYAAFSYNVLSSFFAIAGWFLTTALYARLVRGDVNWGLPEEELRPVPA